MFELLFAYVLHTFDCSCHNKGLQSIQLFVGLLIALMLNNHHLRLLSISESKKLNMKLIITMHAVSMSGLLVQ